MNKGTLIDLLRIVGLLMVIVSHIISIEFAIPQGFGIQGFYYTNIGGWAVSLFFFISGYALEQRYRDGVDKKTFFRKRLVHLYIIYFLCLGVELLLLGEVNDLLSDWQHMFCGLTATCAFFGLTRTAAMGTGWFIGALVAQYLMFPWFHDGLKKNRRLFVILVLGVALIVRAITFPLNDVIFRFVDWFPLTRMLEFGGGMIVASLGSGQMKRHPRLITIAAWVFPMYLIHLDFYITRGVIGLAIAGIISMMIVWIASWIEERVGGTAREKTQPHVTASASVPIQ